MAIIRFMSKERLFKDLVFEKTKLIPRGKISTYKTIARAIGKKRAARAVGNALNKNCDIEVPCHRVVRSDGRIGGYNKGADEKKKLLIKEGFRVVKNKINLDKYLFKFKKITKHQETKTKQ